jgi:hypothetical protein
MRIGMVGLGKVVSNAAISQIPPALVVKFQAVDIAEVIRCPIR